MQPLRCPVCHVDHVTEYVDGYASCRTCNHKFTKYEELHDIFHQLWAEASRIPHYKKELWNRMMELIFRK